MVKLEEITATTKPTAVTVVSCPHSFRREFSFGTNTSAYQNNRPSTEIYRAVPNTTEKND